MLPELPPRLPPPSPLLVDPGLVVAVGPRDTIGIFNEKPLSEAAPAGSERGREKHYKSVASLVLYYRTGTFYNYSWSTVTKVVLNVV